MYPSKRRRIEEASATLCKPFRSPLKTSTNHSKPRPCNEEDDPHEHIPKRLKQPTLETKNITPNDDASQNSQLASKEPELTVTDDLAALQKRYSALAQELRRLKQDLDVTEQALKIDHDSHVDQIPKLILIWRNIARDAADDVFTATQKRVNNMGGMRAWQESALHSSEYWQAQARSQESTQPARRNRTSNDGSELSDSDDSRRQGENYDGEGKMEQEDLSIGMMLRHLNIDPELLGYDEEMQCWKT